jgi:hypothetical protein
VLRTTVVTFVVLVLSGCSDDFGLRGPASGAGGTASTPAPADTVSAGLVEVVGLVLDVPTSPDATTTAAQLAIMAHDGDGLRYIGGIVDPRVEVDDEVFDLVSTATAGVFAVTNRQAPSLVYAPEQTWTFRFDLVADDGTRFEFATSIVTPEEDAIVDVVPAPIYYAGQPLTLEVRGLADGGAIAVTPADDPFTATWSTFAWAGPNTIDAGREALESLSPPEIIVPGEAFPSPGPWRIEIHNFRVSDAVSAAGAMAPLGASSWLAAGRARVVGVEMQ